jgi:hypothetical protein
MTAGLTTREVLLVDGYQSLSPRSTGHGLGLDGRREYGACGTHRRHIEGVRRSLRRACR